MNVDLDRYMRALKLIAWLLFTTERSNSGLREQKEIESLPAKSSISNGESRIRCLIIANIQCVGDASRAPNYELLEISKKSRMSTIDATRPSNTIKKEQKDL